VIEYRLTQGNGCAAGGGLNGFRPPDCVSPISVTAAGWRLCAGRILAEFCDLSACGADEFGVF